MSYLPKMFEKLIEDKDYLKETIDDMETGSDFFKSNYMIGLFIVQHEECRQKGATLSIDKDNMTCSICDLKLRDERPRDTNQRRKITK